MPKKCFICGQPAQYFIKDSSDYYCEECAVENFGDVSMLVKVEEQAKIIKKLVEEVDSGEKDYDDSYKEPDSGESDKEE